MKKILVILSVVFFLFLACDEIGKGIEPLPGKMGVDVIFVDSNLPPSTQGLYLFVAPTFPPHAINELFLSPNSLPIAEINRLAQIPGRDTVHTELDLPYGHYQAVGLWWYNQNTESNLADMFSLITYTRLNPETFKFESGVTEFDITPENPEVQTELAVDLSRMERDATIEGTINFNGEFPENTLATAIAAYATVPEKKLDYLIYLESMDYSIGENPYHFKLPVSNKVNKTIKYLVVLWLSDRAGLDSFQTLGFYRNPADSTQPGEIKIRKNVSEYTGYNIDADWSNAQDAEWGSK